MYEAEKLSLEAMGRFVEASEELRFEGENRHRVYGWVEQLLVRQEYAQQGKESRGPSIGKDLDAATAADRRR